MSFFNKARVGLLLCIFVLSGGASGEAQTRWSPEEMRLLRALWIDDLGPPPADPTNRFADDPVAAAFGELLFNDVSFSGNRRVSCASCHEERNGFTDLKPLGEGVARGNRRTMPIPAAIYSPWQFWDGRADSLWAQALGPVENPLEHGFTRTEVVRLLQTRYAAWYERVFGAFPGVLSTPYPQRASPLGDESAKAAWESMSAEQRAAVDLVFANFGKAIAAFERTRAIPRSRFDEYLAALFSGRDTAVLEAEEIAGLRLFIGKGECTQCHNGPLLTNHHFANTGVPARRGLPADQGRSEGIRIALADPFNCRGRFSDSGGAGCDELEFAVTDGPQLIRAYKVPSLRGVAQRAPYMHAGQFRTLERVLAHYSAAPSAPAGTSEIEPRNLTASERRQLIAFLRSLNPIAGRMATAESL